jgi:putative FmdB family regulatory protein
MMPIYEYCCSQGHRCDRLRKYTQRDRGVRCGECGRAMKRVLSLPHCAPDGVYSYAPNIGSPEAFERRQAAIRERRDGGPGVIPKQDQPPQRED